MPGNIIWSPLQKAIFQDIHDGKGNTVISAKAGAAKTSTLVEGVKYIPKSAKKVIFVAFNKKIAEELDDRIGKSYIEVRTIHSKSFATVKAHFGKVALDPDKALNIITNILYTKGFKKFEKQKFDLAFSMNRVVSICKGALVDTPSKIDLLLDRFDVDIFDMERDEFIKTICQVLRQCKEQKEVVDFTDMVWFPYVYRMKFEQYDIVVCDELQDLNNAQINAVLSMCKPNGRIIAAGDPDQVLYDFTGVEIDMVEKLVARLNAKVLQLSVSYRCAKNIVKLAQEIVPDIEAAPNAIEGEVKHMPEKDFLKYVKPGDFILSRVNAPLIYHCLALLRMGVPANIQGRDVGANLAYMIKKSEAKTVPEFTKWLEEWKAAEIARLRAKNRDPILVIDKAACLDALCEGEKSLDAVLDNIKELFNDGDEKDRVICSSIHKSKGLERDRVFLLNKTLRRGINKSENNIAYVSYTRARKELILVG